MSCEIKFDLNDIVLVPSAQTNINSRSECNTYTVFKNRGIGTTLPIIAAPMDTVVSEDNMDLYVKNGIIPCMPRGQYYMNLYSHLFFQSFGLGEIEEQFIHPYDPGMKFFNYDNILIDCANGHMSRVVNVVKEIKIHYPKVTVMVGNIANPETYKILSEAGADYCRCSVGTGAGCTTAANVAINFPMGSLISECYKLKVDNLLTCKIVADGGMRNYSDIIKCLAIGADYCMVGSLFNKAIESAGFNYLYGIKINYKLAKFLWKYNFPIKKKYRGMSTKAVQRSWGKSKLVTAEGITKYQNVEYSLDQWTENFTDYLKSAMSYCNAKNLDEFIGKANYVHITQNAYARFNK